MKQLSSIFIITFIIYSITLNSSVTHIWSSSGTNDTTRTVHIFGDGFNGGVSGVTLQKSGYTNVNAVNISVVNDNYLTCEFDLTEVSATTYNLIVNFDTLYFYFRDTLDMCFTVNNYINHLNNWDKTDLPSGGAGFELVVGDGNINGQLEIYSVNLGYYVYQFNFYGGTWHKVDIGYLGLEVQRVAVGDGNNDGDLEVYGACRDYHIYQFKWNYDNWDKTDLGLGGYWMRNVVIGDGNNDGDIEVYGASTIGHLNQFKVIPEVGVEEIIETPAIFTISYSYTSADEMIFYLALPEECNISLKIYDISGREVENLISGQLSPAFYNIPFNPERSGIYFYGLESPYLTETGKFTILR